MGRCNLWAERGSQQGAPGGEVLVTGLLLRKFGGNQGPSADKKAKRAPMQHPLQHTHTHATAGPCPLKRYPELVSII